MAYLEVDKLTKTFTTPGGRRVVALDEVCFSIERGEVLSIIGHNGSGKTTLLNCIRSVFPPDGGTIRVDDCDIARARPRISSVHQDVGAGVVPSMTALENMTLAMSDRPAFFYTFPTRRFRAVIYAFLEEAGLLERFLAFEDAPASELSGGQCQQLAIAMALMRKPHILLLDEFVANLDPETREQVLTLTRRSLQRDAITTILVTHDKATASAWGDSLLELSVGRCVHLHRRHDRVEEPVAHEMMGPCWRGC